jgi:hypothetical protein
MAMSDQFDEDEPLLAGMNEWPADLFAEPPADLRAAVLARTSAIVRRRVLWRRAALACSLMMAYLAGVATEPLWRAANPALTRSAPAPVPQPAPTRELAPTPEPVPEPVEAAVPDLSTIAQSISSLRERGDRMLNERGDISGALQCYGELLALLPDQERTQLRAEDSWLLVELKRAAPTQLR